jgi:hypothetical protein
MSEFDLPEEELWGLFDGQCQACDMYGRVNDLSLCEDCADKFERDMIRSREWQYSGAAFGLSPEGCEELRRKVIAEYGEALELIAPAKKSPKKKSRDREPKKRK